MQGKANLMEITLRHWCSPVFLLHISEHFFLKTVLEECLWK